MNPSSPKAAARGFSLIEVAITMGIMVFAFFGLLGLFPLALEQSRSCVSETRGAQIARMVFSTLQSESFTSAECFGDSTEGPLDLSTLDTSSAPVVMYASYDSVGNATITRTDVPPVDATYRMELHFTLVPSLAAGGASRGNNVRLLITGGSLGKTIAFQGADFVSALKRVAATQ